MSRPLWGPAGGPCLAVYCAGPCLERVRPLKQSLESLGARVQICTEADLLEGPLFGEVGDASPSSPSSSVASLQRQRSIRGWDRGWRTPDGGKAHSPATSTDRCGQGASAEDVGGDAPQPLHAEAPTCDAVLVLWSQFFHASLQTRLVELSERAGARGALLLNDVRRLFEMQDRRWVLRKLQERGIPTPHFVECSRESGRDPALEEHSDHIVVGGKRINKPFFEKPVDRRDREIYVYFPKEAGGGRALVSTRESGDVDCIFRFDASSRVRREGSFVYQEYTQSDGLMVQAVCCGGQAYGNAVHTGILKPSLASARESVLSTAITATGGSPVFLRQEEKLIAQNLSMILHQTLFGITFARAHAGKDGQLTSYVIDVWPSVPRAGFGLFCDDVGRAMLAAMCKRLPTPGMHMRSRSVPQFGDLSPGAPMEGFLSPIRGKNKQVSDAQAAAVCDDAEEDALCLLLLCRHGARTPKQKAKAKVKMPSEFAAGWLCGWLAGAEFPSSGAVEPPAAFDLRAKDQLQRLGAAARNLQASGHSLGTLADALANADRLGEACHAKLGRDAQVLNVAMKWGGELTPAGIRAAEVFGRAFRRGMCEDIDVGSVRHDMKVYSSREPRCQQTAAAFCKGFLRLTTPALPPIIAALVRKEEAGLLDAGNDFKNYVGKGKKSDVSEASGDCSAPSGCGCVSLDTTWAELEALIGSPAIRTAFHTAVTSPALAPFNAPRPALRALSELAERLLAAVAAEGSCEAFENAETAGLLRERYKDVLRELQLGESPHSFEKVQKLLDNLEYDGRHNLGAMPPGARSALEVALPLCEAVCDAQTALEASRRTGQRDVTGLQLLQKLRWDLRVASGADLGEEKTHVWRHEHLYGCNGGTAKPCVRTRLYFCHNSHIQGLLLSLAGSSVNADTVDAVVAARLGFLAHIAIRLSRRRSDGELRVACHVGRTGGEADENGTALLFDLPLAEVDAWFTDLLKAAD